MGKNYSHLSCEQRQEMSNSLKAGKSVKDIASLLGLHISTIYREIERGRNPNTHEYDPDYAEQKYQMSLAEKGKIPCLEENKEMAGMLSKFILNDGLSPEQALLKLREYGYAEIPTKTTVYAAIDRGLLPDVTRESLYSRNITIFSDGLIYLPKWIREKLNFGDGDKLSCEVDNDKLIIKKENE